MKRVVFGIFAHPDDEAFLSSGSFLKWTDEGAKLHLICATRGENGQNPDEVADLSTTRLKEWHEAGRLLGASSQTQLDYPDGSLSNRLFHELAKKMVAVINQHADDNAKIDLVTYENCGITGHLDHIAMSFITTYIYMNLKEKYSNLRLLYGCACDAISPRNDVSYVFMPKGCSHSDVDITEDVHDVLERKKAVMRAHRSQRKDCEAIIKQLGDNLAYEHFRVFKN